MILISSQRANTPVSVDEQGNPIWDNFTEPALSILQAAYAEGDWVEMPEPVPTVIIRSIDMRRLRLALLQMDLLDDIDNAIAAQPKAAQIEWEFATDVRADHPLVVALATAMSLDIDEIFDLAESFT